MLVTKTNKDMIRPNAIQILEENLRESSCETLKEYVEISAENDPNFFRWLFLDELLNDFDMSLTNEQREEYNSFIQSL
jgi:hypothetical protein